MVITTSWDDGYPSDRRLADLLDKYGMAATFYLPRRSQRETLQCTEIKDLSSRFEIGAHTLDHLDLTTLDPARAKDQICDSKHWLESLLGTSCNLFCPPMGKFTRQHVEMIQQCGYLGFRTVEMGSIRRPVCETPPIELTTTIQVHPHHPVAYLKNALRRRRVGATLAALRLLAQPDWRRRANGYLREAIPRGGVFHLWGHSWEIDDNHQWQPLELLLQDLEKLVMSGDAVVRTNGQLAKWIASQSGDVK